MEHSKYKWPRISMEFSHLDTVVTLDELEKVLKLTKTGKSP
jgi:hypothetical protein